MRFAIFGLAFLTSLSNAALNAPCGGSSDYWCNESIGEYCWTPDGADPNGPGICAMLGGEVLATSNIIPRPLAPPTIVETIAPPRVIAPVAPIPPRVIAPPVAPPIPQMMSPIGMNQMMSPFAMNQMMSPPISPVMQIMNAGRPGMRPGFPMAPTIL